MQTTLELKRGIENTPARTAMLMTLTIIGVTVIGSSESLEGRHLKTIEIKLLQCYENSVYYTKRKEKPFTTGKKQTATSNSENCFQSRDQTTQTTEKTAQLVQGIPQRDRHLNANREISLTANSRSFTPGGLSAPIVGSLLKVIVNNSSNACVDRKGLPQCFPSRRYSSTALSLRSSQPI